MSKLQLTSLSDSDDSDAEGHNTTPQDTTQPETTGRLSDQPREREESAPSLTSYDLSKTVDRGNS